MSFIESEFCSNGEFIIVKEFAPREGGYGRVYKALQTNLADRTIAVKEVKSEAFTLPWNVATVNFTNDDDIRRFKREIDIVAKLQHENILVIHNVLVSKQEETYGEIYMICPFIEGGSAGDKLNCQQSPKKQPFSIADVLKIGDHMCAALEVLEEEKIVHRDIKPWNILLQFKNGDQKKGIQQAILADFGIALHPDYPNSNPGSHPYTQGYGSPEQMKGKPLDSRSDMYALAATLWVLLTGNPKLGYQQLLPLNEPDLKKHRPDVPDELEKVLKKALAEERNRRFKSIKDFREALENSMVPAKDPITPEPASPVPTVQPRPISLPVKISRTWIEVIAMVASITLGLLKIDPVLILPSSVVFGVMLIGGFVGLWRSILLSKWVSLPLFFLSLIAAFVFSVMGFFDITMVLLLICFWTGTILPFATLIPER